MRLRKESDLRSTTKESTDKTEAGTRSKRLESLTLFAGKFSCRLGANEFCFSSHLQNDLVSMKNLASANQFTARKSLLCKRLFLIGFSS
jgi:hypothetical protein